MQFQFYIRHPQGFVVGNTAVNAIGPFATWDDAAEFYEGPQFPRERDGVTSLEAIAVPA